MSVSVKAAVYCGTRNVYQDMVIAVNSLLSNTKVDRVYLLTEDDEFPYSMPANVHTINVSGQTYFDRGGINYHNGWTWMVLMRCALHRVLPELDRVLSLDTDTIVDADISELWDLDLDGYYLAAAKEPYKTNQQGRLYINAGVMMQNLKMLRDGKGDELIHALNTKIYGFCDQDCINEYCQGHILEIPSAYNVNNFTEYTSTPKIIHYAGINSKRWRMYPLVQQYKRNEEPSK